jgi:hypothetical protein
MKAKPNANTRTLRPDKCLVVKSLDSSLRPAALRNMESTAITTRELKTGMEGRSWGVNVVFRCRAGEQSDCAPFALSRRDRRRSHFGEI